MSNKPLSEEEVRNVILKWGRLFDEHAPIADFLPLVAEEGFEIRFRDQVWRGLQGLEEHKEVKRQFFDEKHIYQSIEVTLLEDRAEVAEVMIWEASHWQAPAPRSERIIGTFHHDWVFIRSPRTGLPVILTHEAVSVEWKPGFAPGDSGQMKVTPEMAPHLQR